MILAIEDCRDDQICARDRLLKMLLRRNIRWTGPGAAWTPKHMIWVRSLHFEDLCSQATFIDYLRRGDASLGAPRRSPRFEQVIPDSGHATMIARLRSFCGVGGHRGFEQSLAFAAVTRR